jgi:hypothetical protein
MKARTSEVFPALEAPSTMMICGAFIDASAPAYPLA